MAPEEIIIYVGSAVFASLAVLLLISVVKEVRNRKPGASRADRRE